MGITYTELSVFGRLRKINKLGPWGMWEELVRVWGDTLSPQQIYEKVRFFHWNYAINRHKQTAITPSIHMEAYGCVETSLFISILFPHLKKLAC